MSRTWTRCGALVCGVMLLAWGAAGQEAGTIRHQVGGGTTHTVESATTLPHQGGAATTLSHQGGGATVSHKIVQLDKGMPIETKVILPFEAKLVTGAPYSAESVTESVQTLADGNRIVQRATGRVYRDSQGRVRREEDREPGIVSWIAINDPVARVSYSLDPATNVATKTATRDVKIHITPSRSDPADLERREKIKQEFRAQIAHEVKEEYVTARGNVQRLVHDQPRWEEKVEQLPAREIEGVSAEGTRTTRTIPAGLIGNERPIVIVSEEWRSPELDVLVLTTTSDPRTGESVYRLTGINRAEPAASLFEVPPAYTVKEAQIRIDGREVQER